MLVHKQAVSRVLINVVGVHVNVKGHSERIYSQWLNIIKLNMLGSHRN